MTGDYECTLKSSSFIITVVHIMRSQLFQSNMISLCEKQIEKEVVTHDLWLNMYEHEQQAQSSIKSPFALHGRKSHTGFKQHEGEQMISEFIFR